MANSEQRTANSAGQPEQRTANSEQQGSLSRAKSAKNDEFYTQYNDIEKEMNGYLEYNPNVFGNKTILLPCDDTLNGVILQNTLLRILKGLVLKNSLVQVMRLIASH